MNRRAIRILFATFWSSSGWKDEADRSVTPEDIAYAKSAGVMFDPLHSSHAQLVARAIRARDLLTPRQVADGFLASLSSRRVELRSALGSYAVLRLFPEHAYQRREKQCAICGAYSGGNEGQDLNVLSFERFKWGGVRHDQPVYAVFDLEQFVVSDHPTPTQKDIGLFRKLVKAISASPRGTSSATLSKHLGTIGIKSNKAERDVMIGILGLCGVLGTAAHPGYDRQFVPYFKREIPARRFVDQPYPVCWWRISDGINWEALNLFFGHVLKERDK